MKKSLFLILSAALAYGVIQDQDLSRFAQELTRPAQSTGSAPESASSDQILQAAFRDKQSDLQVEGTGLVSRILADDNQGSRHQRFILKLPTGQQILIAHNIDLAPRIPGLQKGDKVAFYGEYEWNEKGGVIHWTHHDPGGRHPHGWLKHAGKTYQ